MTSLSYLLKSKRHSFIEDEIKNLEPVMARIFPELRGVTLRITDTNSSYHVASYEWRRAKVEMNFSFFEEDEGRTLAFVLAHETMHAVQWIRRNIPHGERSCDVYTLARLPTELLPKRKAFYVKVPKKVLLFEPSRVTEVAKKAIQLRAEGLRRYIVWFESELRR